MINIVLYFFLTLSIQYTQADFKIKVIEHYYIGTKSEKDSVNATFKIVLKKNDSIDELIYFSTLQEKFTEQESVAIIKALLKLEGDSRICAYPVHNWNNHLFSLPKVKNEYYSIQLEALFLINQFSFDYPQGYSPMPVLQDIVTKEQETISGELIDQAFEKYKVWFEQVKKEGLEKVKNIDPLAGSNIQWMW